MSALRLGMQIRPILAALRRHKMATLLIVLQIALTLAVVTNAVYIVKTRIVHLSRPTGTDEAHLFVIKNDWIGNLDAAHVGAQVQTDLMTLRQLPGVRDAFASDGYPFGAGGKLARIRHQPDPKAHVQLGLIYAADEDAIQTFGIALVAGRNFRADEISSVGPNDKFSPAVCIITRDLADRLFAQGPVLDSTVYLTDNSGPTKIIGVVDRLEGQYIGSTTRTIDEDSILAPVRPAGPVSVVYIVRTHPGQLAAVLRAAPAALLAQNRMRIIDPQGGVITLTEAREQGYAADRGVAIMMAVVCAMLLLATAGGIVGLSSFWVSQRRRQIGIRRALGATRRDILHYFQIENFLIVSAGIALGSLLGLAANLWLMQYREILRMPLWVFGVGAIVLWLLGQLAVLGPALRAAVVPPVVATRTV